MKKVYIQPEWKLSVFESEDVITASTTTVTYDPDGLFGKDNVEVWDW